MSDKSSLPAFNDARAFRFTREPDPAWKLGEGLKAGEGEKGTELARQWKEEEKLGWKTLNLEEMEKPYVFAC